MVTVLKLFIIALGNDPNSEITFSSNASINRASLLLGARVAISLGCVVVPVGGRHLRCMASPCSTHCGILRSWGFGAPGDTSQGENSGVLGVGIRRGELRKWAAVRRV